MKPALLHRLLALAATTLLAACAATAPPPAATPGFVLLGEVHDNPVHHLARAALLRELLAEGRPTVVVFEQLGRAQDLALQQAMPRESQALIEAGKLDQKGWRWPLHQALFDAALAGGAGIRGGNLEREEVRRVVREGEPALPADVAELLRRTPWSADQQQTLLRSMHEGHCGALPASMHAGMALAQRARDATMAQALLSARRAAGPGARVVLIAGNGHVRRDLAVPLYLQAAGVPASDISSRAWLENETPVDGARYDAVLRTPAAPREDPCLALRKSR